AYLLLQLIGQRGNLLTRHRLEDGVCSGIAWLPFIDTRRPLRLTVACARWRLLAICGAKGKDGEGGLGGARHETGRQGFLLHLFDQGVVPGADVRDEGGALLLICLAAKRASQRLSAATDKHLDVVGKGTAKASRQRHGTRLIGLLEVVHIAPVLSRRTR